MIGNKPALCMRIPSTRWSEQASKRLLPFSDGSPLSRETVPLPPPTSSGRIHATVNAAPAGVVRNGSSGGIGVGVHGESGGREKDTERGERSWVEV